MPTREEPPSPVSDPTVPPHHGPGVTFLRSSQARNWRFSAKQIEEMRIHGNEAACVRLQDIWRRERSLKPVDEEPQSSSSSDVITFSTVEEEQALIRYYLTRVHQLVKAFGLPESVEATAITYIKRFYLRNTCMDYHPKNIMLTCLFLAAKAESNPVPLKHFSTKLAGKDASQNAIQDYFETIQKLEFMVSQSLDFQFMVHGAHRALHGLLLDVQQTLQPSPSPDAIRSLIEPARNNLKQSRFTDAELIYTPSQIALACLRLSSDAGKEMVGNYLAQKENRSKEVQEKAEGEKLDWIQKKSRNRIKAVSSPTDQTSLKSSQPDLGSILSEVERLVEEKMRTAHDDVEQVKPIDKKLKLCQNPENMPNSRICHHKEEEKQEILLGKRKSNTAKKEEDPFGDDDDDDVELQQKQGNSKKAKLVS